VYLQPVVAFVVFGSVCGVPPRRVSRYAGTDVKDNFFLLFWDVYNASFIPENIVKNFEVVGISPPDALPVLNRFISPPSPKDRASKLADVGDRGSWTQLRKLYYLAVKDVSKVSAVRLYEALHSL
jgi:hypothetical protein